MEDPKHAAAPPVAETSPDLEELVERADRLIAQATALKERYRDLRERVDALAAAESGEETGPGAVSQPTEGAPDEAQSIRTAATNLALSGASAEEVDAYLRDTFASEDNQEILNELFHLDEKARRRRRRRFVRRR